MEGGSANGTALTGEGMEDHNEDSAPDRTAMFVNIMSGVVVPLSNPDPDGLRWAAANARHLGMAEPQRYDPDDHRDVKSMRRSLVAAGWSYLKATDRSIGLDPVGLDDIERAIHIAMSYGVPHPQSITAMTPEANHIELDGGQVDRLLQGGGIDPEALAWKRATNGDMNAIMSEIRNLPYADRIRVYGSAAQGKPYPGDLDIWLDLRGTAWNLEDAEPILMLARGCPGMFDPIVATDAGCFMYGGWGTMGWQAVSDAGQVEAAVAEQSVPLAEFPDLLCSPEEGEPTPKP